MLKFENTHIFTGYLKQLLASFNLPKYRVYTSDNARYLKEHKKESPEILETIVLTSNTSNANEKFNPNVRYTNYIKNGDVMRYTDGQWVSTSYHYHYNKKELNQTKNLIVKNNVYDSYTHEYLGDYLRFQRDYNDLDLMPLYNCFSNNICHSLSISFNSIGSFIARDPASDSDSDSDSDEYDVTRWQVIKAVNFNTSNQNFKIYMLPVKLFKNYTIAIEAPLGAEFCCGFYDKYYTDSEKLKSLPMYTYQKFNSMSFSSPKLFDKLTYDVLVNAIKQRKLEETDGETVYTDEQVRQIILEYAQQELELKLFIKIPTSTISSITVLEGDYTGFNQSTYYNVRSESASWMTDRLEVKNNTYVFNFDTANTAVIDDDSSDSDSDSDDGTVKIITTKFPDYADRPFKPITTLQLLQANTGTSYPFADRLMEYLVGNTIDQTDEIYDNIVRVQKVMELNNNSFDIAGAWEPKMRLLIYDYMTSKHPDCPITGFSQEVLKDSLGYVDKDVEKYYTAWRTDYVYDKNGNPVDLIGPDNKPIYQDKNLVLKESDSSILTEIYAKVLRETGEQTTNVTVKKTVTKPIATIANIDIYDNLYLDNKKGGTK